MRALLPVLLVAAVVTVVIGLISGDWTGYVIGAVLAMSLWVMLRFGQMGTQESTRAGVSPAAYGASAAVGLVLGGLLVAVTSTEAFWAVGFILAGVLWPATVRARRDRQPR